MARADEAVDVRGDERAAVFNDDDVLAFAASGLAAVFTTFILLMKIICHFFMKAK